MSTAQQLSSSTSLCGRACASLLAERQHLNGLLAARTRLQRAHLCEEVPWRILRPDLLVLIEPEGPAQLLGLLAEIVPSLQKPCVDYVSDTPPIAGSQVSSLRAPHCGCHPQPCMERPAQKQRALRQPGIAEGEADVLRRTSAGAFLEIRRTSFPKPAVLQHSSPTAKGAAAMMGRTRAKAFLGISPSPPWYRRPKPERKP